MLQRITQQSIQYFKCKVALFFRFSNNIALLITRSHLPIAQASSFSFLNMCTFTYATITFITKAHRLFTQVQLLLTTVTVNQRFKQHYLTLIGLVSTMCINAKAMSINDINHCFHYNSCRTCSTNRMGPYHTTSCHQLLMAQKANTHTHTDVHTETTIRNLVHTSLWPVRTWFNN